MSLKAFLGGRLRLCGRLGKINLQRAYTTSSEKKEEIIDLATVEQEPKYEEQVAYEEEERIEQSRNKSRLCPQDRNILYNENPYESEVAYHQFFVDYKRRMLGRYGVEGSGVPAGLAWPTKKDIFVTKEYEKVAYPLTLKEAWTVLAEKEAEKQARIKAREDDIEAKLAKTAQWEREFHAKLAKKEADARVLKERRERLVEEVRRHFGFKVDPKDDRFKAMLEQKEKEERKKAKDARKKAREERLMAQLLGTKEATPPAESAKEATSSPDSAGNLA